ncbi:MAG: UDP-N-acetylmuramoyl-tripeptide--D-alanyl-D-alanine ligase [Peptostreptococcaceae bacterium]|nr:UDP-N-acetylmuramoyl-tripeptide--D-alanyl-D-alanine ligase [Peptostreptococcaceae bacterium]
MNKIDIGFIEKAVSGKLLNGNRNEYIDNVSIDSRRVTESGLFVSLVGVKHDAHKFLDDVYEKGCKSFVISDESWIAKLKDKNDINLILVEDTTVALQDLAKAYLEILDVKKISITGSVGKTTTKDLLYSIVRKSYKAGRNIGNLNNDIGVPLTIFTFDSSLEVVIIEMGTGYDGHIERLAEIVKPDVAIVTTIGSSHIEVHGSRDGILKEKLKISKYFSKSHTLVINESCDILSKERVFNDTGKDFKITSVGSEIKSDILVKNICDLGDKGIEFTLVYFDVEYNVELPILGMHNAYNAALAIAAAYEIGIPVPKAIEGLCDLEMTKNRLEIKKTDKFTLIDDTYNASKESVLSAVDTLISMTGKRKVAILGDMYELGDDTVSSHEIVGRHVAEKNVDILIAIGEYAVDIAEAARTVTSGTKIYYFKTKEDIYSLLADILNEGDVILVKASRGMALEKVVNKIEEID